MARCAAACDYLLLKCVELGAHDNLSAVVIMCGEATGSAVNTNVSADDACASITDTFGGFGITDGMLSPEPSSSLFLESPASGARDRTLTNRALSSTFSADSPSDQSCDREENHRDQNVNVNRHLEFSKESQ